MSQSHSPFFKVFFFYRGGAQTCNPSPKNSLSDCQSSRKLLRSVLLPAVAPAVHCGICGSVLKNVLCQARLCEAISKTNEPTNNFCCILSVCERSLGTFACCPAQKTSKSPLYCSVPNVCLYVCMYVCAGSVCVYLTTIIQRGKGKN